MSMGWRRYLFIVWAILSIAWIAILVALTLNYESSPSAYVRALSSLEGVLKFAAVFFGIFIGPPVVLLVIGIATDRIIGRFRSNIDDRDWGSDR